MSDHFCKYHLGNGLVLHEFTGPDTGGPHDHPCKIHVKVIKNGYLEAIYDRQGNSRTQERWEGDEFIIEPELIHEILHIFDDSCLTLATYEPHVRETRFWRFGEEIESRAWHETQYRVHSD